MRLIEPNIKSNITPFYDMPNITLCIMQPHVHTEIRYKLHFVLKLAHLNY